MNPSLVNKEWSAPLHRENTIMRLLVASALLIMLGALGLQISGIDTAIPLALGADGAIQMQIVLACCYLLGVVLLVTSPDFGAVMKGSWPLFLVPALALLSMAWSPDPFLTLRKGLALLGTMLFGVAIASRYSYVEALRLTINVMCAAVVLSVLWALFVPYQGVHQVTDAYPFQKEHAGSWRGVFGHRTPLGHFSALTFVFVLCYGPLVFKRSFLRYLMLFLSLLCVIKAGSGGALLAAVLLPGIIWVLSVLGKTEYRVRVALLPFLLLILVILIVFGGDMVSFALEILGKQPDFTGRVPLWNYLFEMADERPMLGYGYVAGFAKIVAPQINATGYGTFINAHNGYIEALISFGYVGLSVCLGVLMWQFIQAGKLVLTGSSKNAVANSFPLTVMIYVSATNVVESALLAENSWYVILPAMIAGLLSREFHIQARRSRQRNDRRLFMRPGVRSEHSVFP